ncbi:tigger transposable element-derived protein 1-like [Chrysemys picta bellii]|uniref:tigger transposable element-derived protein 1-like n=1 Tax=Chrysemys picta bellii TaxID=8478 RepID=UPI0032B143E5
MFKAYYLWRTFSMLTEETAGEGKPNVKEFWKSYDILNDVENIDALWEEVTLQCMNGIWHCAWPDAVHRFMGFDAVPALEQEIVKLAKDVGFEEVEEEDEQELLESHAELLTNEELIELDQPQISEESKDDDDDDVGQEARSLMTKNLSHFFGLLDEMTEIIQSGDPFRERSAKVSRALNDSVACYREICRSKIHAGEQTSIKSFFKDFCNQKASHGKASPRKSSHHPYLNLA